MMVVCIAIYPAVGIKRFIQSFLWSIVQAASKGHCRWVSPAMKMATYSSGSAMATGSDLLMAYCASAASTATASEA